MSNDKLFIPTKCKVGFNTRTDTYTGKLGYIIYNDGKVWRKENSWENWREKYITDEELEQKRLNIYNNRIENYTGCYNRYLSYKDSNIKWQKDEYNQIKDTSLEEYLEINVGLYANYTYNPSKESNDITINPIEFENNPTEGFVLNKKVGGDNYSWNPRQTYCRVYDPRGWEFEISISNLLFILECTNSIKGKGLEGEFIYSWSGKDLVLLPCDSENYQSSIKHTELQSKKVSAKELKVGNTYVNSNGDELIYLGKLPIVREVKDGIEEYSYESYTGYKQTSTRTKYKNVIQKQFIFFGKEKYYYSNILISNKSDYNNYNLLTSLTTIKQEISTQIPENFAELVENYYKLFKTTLNSTTNE